MRTNPSFRKVLSSTIVIILTTHSLAFGIECKFENLQNIESFDESPLTAGADYFRVPYINWRFKESDPVERKQLKKQNTAPFGRFRQYEIYYQYRLDTTDAKEPFLVDIQDTTNHSTITDENENNTFYHDQKDMFQKAAEQRFLRDVPQVLAYEALNKRLQCVKTLFLGVNDTLEKHRKDLDTAMTGFVKQVQTGLADEIKRSIETLPKDGRTIEVHIHIHNDSTPQ